MYLLLVEFEIDPKFTALFNEAVSLQASNSLKEEPDCHFFRVTRHEEEPNIFILSEVYTDAAAFEFHLTTDHFISFDFIVKDWVIEKTVRFIEPLMTGK